MNIDDKEIFDYCYKQYKKDCLNMGKYWCYQEKNFLDFVYYEKYKQKYIKLIRLKK